MAKDPFDNDTERDYKLIRWEYLISLSDASKKYNRHHKTLNINLRNGIFVDSIDCIKIGRTWILDDRRLQDIYINNVHQNTFPPKPFPRDKERNYELIKWEYLISLLDASKKYNKNNKTINRYILSGKLVEGIDCAKIGKTWVLDDRKLQDFFKAKENKIED